LAIDATTRRTLELVQNSRDGGVEGSLFSCMNMTRTVGGARALRDWLLNPSTDLAAITRRHDAVEMLCRQANERSELADRMKYVADLERIAARVELNIAAPRELGALRDSLAELPRLRGLLAAVNAAPASAALLDEISQALVVSPELSGQLLADLVDAPPPHAKEGGIFRDGASEAVDHLRNLRGTGRSWIAGLEAQERERTGIGSLKIRFNNVQGFFIEVTKANLSKVPASYIRKQSTVNGERFVTPELKQMEHEVLTAEARQYELEREMFGALRDRLKPYCMQMRAAYARLCELDVLVAFAELAELDGLIRPAMTAESVLEIEDGRHPVIARLLQGSFVPNSVRLSADAERCIILTGPNMGGKSTYLRQAGLIAVMAQAGSFVPAKGARIGVIARVFARIGASDDLLEGESTFMVEMREAAHIVANATSASLLLIDEIGRGTATSDGQAIARAVLEWIVERLSCRTLFATHFHELTELSRLYPGIVNLSVGVVEEGDSVLFTHTICSGPANKSYGLEVAKLAGLPDNLIARARELLAEAETLRARLEKGQYSEHQLEMFTARPAAVEREVPPKDYSGLKRAAAKLQAADLNAMTPLEALNLLDVVRRDLNTEQQEE